VSSATRSACALSVERDAAARSTTNVPAAAPPESATNSATSAITAAGLGTRRLFIVHLLSVVPRTVIGPPNAPLMQIGRRGRS
jgi:hypothetical protein